MAPSFFCATRAHPHLCSQSRDHFFQLLIVHRRSTYFPIVRHCHRLRHHLLFYVGRYGQT